MNIKTTTLKRAAIVVLLILAAWTGAARASQIDINAPAGSSSFFGQSIKVLSNGNIVVADLSYSIPGGAANVGAVHLYDGASLTLISSLTGTTANDFVGDMGIIVLSKGNFLVLSSNWNGGRGAVTFVNGETGLNGAVSASNSLVGTNANDRVGCCIDDGITQLPSVYVLANGNYVVASRYWKNGAVNNAGAVTWGSGASGISGTISAANSLVGSMESDQIGFRVTTLDNGNYVVNSPIWNGGRGAATFGNGGTGVKGTISATNSLVGSAADDNVGWNTRALANGNYVVGSYNWNGGRGAATFGDGRTGVVGAVSAANSLVGSAASDNVGLIPVALSNGNYLVVSEWWNNGAISDAGAVTFGNGEQGIVGTISAANSLVGSASGDRIGTGGATALVNGNYVVRSSRWNGNRGAATLGNGAGGTVGAVSASNSLVGTTANDRVGDQVYALTNGNYVVASYNWNGRRGAATFGNGATGITGAVSAANSLVGSTANDTVGVRFAVLTNGNYVVGSPFWSNGGITGAGMAAFGNGSTGISGTVSSANSLIGSATNDGVGGDLTALTNGNYVVSSSFWNGRRGAATFGNGATGITGTISAANSLVGSTANDAVSGSRITALSNGNYVVKSDNWNSFTGAATFGNGTTGIVGTVSAANSLVGSTANDRVGSNGFAFSNGNYAVSTGDWRNTSVGISSAGAFTFGNGATGTKGAVSSANSVVGTSTNDVKASFYAFDETRNRLIVARINKLSVLFFNAVAVADGNLNDPVVFGGTAPNALVNAVIPNGRTVTINAVTNVGQVLVECGGNLAGGSSAAYIVGSVRKNYCGATGESFVYPVGDGANYTPLTVSNLSGTGNLTASVTDATLPGLSPASSLSRYWSLNGSGISGNLTFKYADADVNGNEATYRAHRRSNGIIAVIPSGVNAAENTFTVLNVSQFSDWTAASSALPPTAASVLIGGRVRGSKERGLANATVYLTDQTGETRIARTNPFGYFRFNDVQAGQTVLLTIFSKRFQYSPMAVTVTGETTDLNFNSEP